MQEFAKHRVEMDERMVLSVFRLPEPHYQTVELQRADADLRAKYELQLDETRSAADERVREAQRSADERYM